MKRRIKALLVGICIGLALWIPSLSRKEPSPTALVPGNALASQENVPLSDEARSNALQAMDTWSGEQSAPEAAQAPDRDPLDFSDSLGFVVDSSLDLPVQESAVWQDRYARLVFALDRSNLASIKIVDATLVDLSTEEVDWTQAVERNGVTIQLRYEVGGPMEAHWLRDGYSFLLHLAEGDLAEDSFTDWAFHFAGHLAAVPSAGA